MQQKKRLPFFFISVSGFRTSKGIQLPITKVKPSLQEYISSVMHNSKGADLKRLKS